MSRSAGFSRCLCPSCTETSGGATKTGLTAGPASIAAPPDQLSERTLRPGGVEADAAASAPGPSSAEFHFKAVVVYDDDGQALGRIAIDPGEDWRWTCRDCGHGTHDHLSSSAALAGFEAHVQRRHA